MSDGDNVVPIDPRMEQLEKFSPDVRRLVMELAKNSGTSGNGGGGNSGIEIRVARLEDDVKEIKSDLKSMKTDTHEMKLDMAVIKNDIANIKQNMVNKADLAGFETNLIKWLVGAVIAGIGLAVGIAKLI